MQEVPEKTKESPGAPWQFVGLLPLFDPPRHDSAETIRKALNLGVNVKMITGNFTLFILFQFFNILLLCTFLCCSVVIDCSTLLLFYKEILYRLFCNR